MKENQQQHDPHFLPLPPAPPSAWERWRNAWTGKKFFKVAAAVFVVGWLFLYRIG